MKYKGDPDYQHDSRPCTGVLLTNLGTPDAPTAKALQKYLAEFLSDPRVIEVPKLIWWFILHGIILRIRPGRSAAAYKKIWTDAGSPLLAITKKQVGALAALLSDKNIRLQPAMRYGNPSIKAGLEKLRQANMNRLLIFPLYPQYAAATTASTFDAVAEVLKTWRYIPELRMITHYHDHPDYISALANSINKHRQLYQRPDKLLFSFHGLPKHYVLAGDPYHCECHKTARLVAEKLKLNDDDWLVTFQSRFGAREWLQPYTDKTLTALAENGTKHVQVVCPGFSADCLETLEEINIQNKKIFIAAGGESFSYIPALNDDHEHIATLAKIMMQHLRGWEDQRHDRNATKLRAVRMGAHQ